MAKKPSSEPRGDRAAPSPPLQAGSRERTSREPASPAPVTMASPTQCLTFYLDGQEYAVGILRVREIVEYDELTHVPSAPAWIRGVMNLRGAVVTVVDLSVKIGSAPTPVTKRSCVVILDLEVAGEAVAMGVLVDAVGRVIDLASDSLGGVPSFGTAMPAGYLLGMAHVDAKLVPVIDVVEIVLADVDELGPAALALAAEPDAPRVADGGQPSQTPPSG